jgi:hypothetical protein
MRHVLLCALLLLPTAALAKKKNKAPPPPPVGWHTDEGAPRACYHPPDWSKLAEIARKQERAKALDEMTKQWKGQRNDGVSFDEGAIGDLEVTLLGRPEQIENVARQNLDYCKKSAGDVGPWGSWVKGLSGKLNAGECLARFDYTLWNYLELGGSWQQPVSVCKGDKIRISGTLKDKYRTSDSGPWITVEGDPASPTAGKADMPCNMEGCLNGMLIARFVSKDGVELIIPVGAQKVFVAPEHGELTYRINDAVLYDNAWFKNGAIEDHTAIELTPAE